MISVLLKQGDGFSCCIGVALSVLPTVLLFC
jgi:hypothetical protein